jgi:PhnB protein
MQINPYVFFDGRCEEALNFYRTALGAEVTMLMRFKEAPEQPPPGTLPPDAGDKVMHAELRIGSSVIFASDGCEFANNTSRRGISLALSVDSDADATRIFEALAADGQVNMPLGKTFFASSFGMVKDRFGVEWMIMHGPQ